MWQSRRFQVTGPPWIILRQERSASTAAMALSSASNSSPAVARAAWRPCAISRSTSSAMTSSSQVSASAVAQSAYSRVSSPKGSKQA